MQASHTCTVISLICLKKKTFCVPTMNLNFEPERQSICMNKKWRPLNWRSLKVETNLIVPFIHVLEAFFGLVHHLWLLAPWWCYVALWRRRWRRTMNNPRSMIIALYSFDPSSSWAGHGGSCSTSRSEARTPNLQIVREEEIPRSICTLKYSCKRLEELTLM